MTSFVQRVTIVLAPLAALAVACTAFGVAPSSDGAADPDGATDGATSISDAGSEDVSVGDGADGGDPCSGATFCETFDTGSFDEIRARWDESGGDGALAIITEGTRRALQSHVVNGTEARLSRSLGVIAPTTEVVVRAVVKATPPTGRYELFTLDLEGTNAFDDYEVMSREGELLVDGVEAAASVADGQWHTLELHVTKTHIAFVIDGTAATGRQLDRRPAEFFLRIGAYATSTLNATVDIDFIRVDVKP